MKEETPRKSEESKQEVGNLEKVESERGRVGENTKE